MQRTSAILLAIVTITVVIHACEDKNRNTSNPQQKLAEKHCGSCHAFPSPDLLDKKTWRENVLPPMARLMGWDPVYEQAIVDSPTVSLEEWKSIFRYYLQNAPEKIQAQEREPIIDTIEGFEFFEHRRSPARKASVSFVNINPSNKLIVAAYSGDSSFRSFNDNLNQRHVQKLSGVLVDLLPSSDTSRGFVSAIATFIGILNPNDKKTGSVSRVLVTDQQRLIEQRSLADSLPRPVQTIAISNGGNRQLVVCGFGNKEGALMLIDTSSDKETVLIPLPGSIRAAVRDMNGDGKQDIVVLMAQAREGIYILERQNNGSFAISELLGFPPVYGSSYFEFADFDNDGTDEILYTCGDNADYSSNLLKPYHGIYIFKRSKDINYERKYFFPLNGAFKAVAADLDGDSRNDIAAVSFFPDLTNQPQESFVILKQRGDMDFKPYALPRRFHTRWIVMDVADIDGDGDSDIAIGSMLLPDEEIPGSTTKPELLLLKNKLHSP
jgi:hypothetical protein